MFVATGAWLNRKLGVPGEDALGVWEGLSFLSDVNDGKKPVLGARVLVIGSSEMAIDAARCALRLPGVQLRAPGLSRKPRRNAGPFPGSIRCSG